MYFNFVILFICSIVVAQEGEPVDLDPNHNLKFVFEIVRHGARAPIIADSRFEAGFAPGELTPNGMRQRYLLGRYNYQRFHTALGSDLLTSKGLYVVSTDVHRTIQSGYSEIFGMFNQSNAIALQITQKQSAALHLPFVVRNKTEINSNLALQAAPDGFVDFPLHTYIDRTRWDNNGPGFDSCNYAHTSQQIRSKNNSIYADYASVQTKLVDAYADDNFKNDQNETLNSTYFQNLDFHTFSRYSDIIYAERWNMIPQNHNFTTEEIQALNTTVTVILTEPYTNYARQLLITKQMFEPMLNLDFDHEDATQTPKPKYMLYSGHDDNIANHLMVYMPDEHFTNIPYAASIYLELYDVFGVWYVRGDYNGTPVKLRGCGGFMQCEWSAFKKHMNDLLYTGDLKEACVPNYKPSDPPGEIDEHFLSEYVDKFGY